MLRDALVRYNKAIASLPSNVAKELGNLALSSDPKHFYKVYNGCGYLKDEKASKSDEEADWYRYSDKAGGNKKNNFSKTIAGSDSLLEVLRKLW